MGRKKTNATKLPSVAPAKPNRAPYYAIYCRIRPEIGEALEAYLGATRPEPTTKAVLETALEDFLIAKGYLPPIDQKD